MHLAVYYATDAAAILRTHAPYATTLATVVDELPAIHCVIARLGGPVRDLFRVPPPSRRRIGPFHRSWPRAA